MDYIAYKLEYKRKRYLPRELRYLSWFNRFLKPITAAYWLFEANTEAEIKAYYRQLYPQLTWDEIAKKLSISIATKDSMKTYLRLYSFNKADADYIQTKLMSLEFPAPVEAEIVGLTIDRDHKTGQMLYIVSSRQPNRPDALPKEVIIPFWNAVRIDWRHIKDLPTKY